MKKVNILLLAFIIIVACKSGNFETEDLYGSWEVYEWKIEETGQSRNNKMDMKFNADMTYEVDYGSELEEGDYWIANSYLHTVEKNQSEKKVKLQKLNTDTLQFQMNRGGMLENVIMIRSDRQ